MLRIMIIIATLLVGICAADAQAPVPTSQPPSDPSAKASLPASQRGPAFPKGVSSDHRNPANWIAAPTTPDPSNEPAWERDAQRRYEYLQRYQ